MPRYRNDALRSGNQFLPTELDPGFIGVNNKADPSVLRTAHAYSAVNQEILGPGVLSAARNVRMADGVVTTRDGWLAPLHLNQPWWTGAAADDYEVVGSGVFSDPDGVEWLLLAAIDDTGADPVSVVYALRDDTAYHTLELAAGLRFTSGSPVDLVQAFDGVIAFRGAGVGSEDEQTPLVWDGDWSVPTFTEVVQTSAGSFEDPIPNAASAVVMSNRLMCASGRDTVAVSDILDFTRWDSALNEFRINEGSDDRIVALVPWRDTNLLVLMEQSVHLIAGVSGDLSGVVVKTLNRALGCVGPRAWAYLGGDVAFLSQDGIYRISEVLSDSRQVAEIPMSDPVTGYIQRINPAAIHQVCAVTDGTSVRWALPLDGSAENNAVLVFDTSTQTWMGIDWWTDRSDDVPAFRIDRLHRVDYLPSNAGTAGQRGAGGKVAIGIRTGGKPEVVMLDVPGAQGDSFLWTSGTTSTADYRTTGGAILSDFSTRGYVWGDLGIKQCRSVNLALEVLGATWHVLSTSDGYNEQVTLLSDRTVDRSQYVIWGKAPYVVSNVNGDFAEPYREDYSVLLPVVLGTDGVELEVYQAMTEAATVRSTDRWTGFRVIATAGMIRLKSLQAEALLTGPQMRVTL